MGQKLCQDTAHCPVCVEGGLIRLRRRGENCLESTTTNRDCMTTRSSLDHYNHYRSPLAGRGRLLRKSSVSMCRIDCSLRGEEIQQLKAGPPSKSAGDWAASISGQMAGIPHVQRCSLSLGPKEKLWCPVPAGGQDIQGVKVSGRERGFHRRD